MKLANRIDIGTELTVKNMPVTVCSVFSDTKKRIFRVENKNKDRYQFIIFNDNIVSKLFKLN